MSAIRDGRIPVELNGEKFYLLFSLNALDEMQDRFGGYNNLDKAFDQNNPEMIKDLRWLLTLVINEGMEEGKQQLTEKQVGRMIHLGNIQQVREAIFTAFVHSVNGGEQEEETGEVDDEGEVKAVRDV